jgi:hypothetical protein
MNVVGVDPFPVEKADDHSLFELHQKVTSEERTSCRNGCFAQLAETRFRNLRRCESQGRILIDAIGDVGGFRKRVIPPPSFKHNSSLRRTAANTRSDGKVGEPAEGIPSSGCVNANSLPWLATHRASGPIGIRTSQTLGACSKVVMARSPYLNEFLKTVSQKGRKACRAAIAARAEEWSGISVSVIGR